MGAGPVVGEVPRCMRAIVKTRAGRGAELREVPVPDVGPDEVLIQVKAASVCGSDVHIYVWDSWAANRIKVPRVFGHEVSGTIVRMGKGVDGPAPGSWVSCETHITCGRCTQCRTGQEHICRECAILGIDIDGAFAEYVRVPAKNIWCTDPSIKADVASAQEPLGNAVYTVMGHGDWGVASKDVLVMGTGPIGLFSIGVAKACGASRVFSVDLSQYRLSLAKAMGSDYCINADEEDVESFILDRTGGEGVDVLLEMSGKGLVQGLRLLKSGGRASLLGLPPSSVSLDISEGIVFKGLRIEGITGRKVWATWYQVDGLLRSGGLDISPVITHRFSLEDFEEAFELAASGMCGKVLLCP